MKKLGIGSVFALVFGLALFLSAAPASAQILCAGCDCTSSCDQICYTGPEIPDCPGCNESTCGVSGSACGGNCPPPPPPECGQTASCTNTINGGAGGDTLFGGTQNDCINGFGGDDTLSGNAGDDTIDGGDGNDTIYGNSGNDCLIGGPGADHANGHTGTDACTAETEHNCEL